MNKGKRYEIIQLTIIGKRKMNLMSNRYDKRNGYFRRSWGEGRGVGLE
jgi:hypothetical protein